MLTLDYKPTPRSHTHWQATQCNRTDQSLPKSMPAQLHGGQESTGYNSTYPKGGVSCSKDSFVVNQTLVFQIKFCGKSPALRVAAKRYATFYTRNLNTENEID